MTITNGYATLAQLHTELGLTISDVADDGRLEMAIAAASRQIDGHTGRRFWQDGSVVTREFYADNSACCYTDDISTVTGLIVKVDSGDNGLFSTTLTITTNFILLPTNAADDVPVRPYTEIRIVDSGLSAFPVSSSGRPGCQVTAKFGWPAIPDDITKAALIQSSQLFKASDAVFGAAQFGEAGVALRVQARLNPMAEALLETYCHPRVA
jgi:hypothetical protein